MQYAIHEDFFADVEKKLNRIAKKCKKFGNEFTFDIVGEELRTDKKSKSMHKFIIVDVEGTAKINDWEFIAVLDISKHGNIIRRYNNDIELPEVFMHSENICEHCNTKRMRNSLYVIHNTVTGDFKQVGKNCLGVYTHGLDIEYVASYMDGITELEKYCGVFYQGGTRYFSVSEIIDYANVFVNKIGYLKSDGYGISTKSLVCNMLRNDMYCNKLSDRINLVNKELCQHRFDAKFYQSDFMQDNTDEVQAIIEYYLSCDDSGEFIHNVKLMLDEGYVSYKHIGYLCYLPSGYAKHIERENKIAQRKTEKHEHYGEIGKRYRNIAIKDIRFITQFETAYGLMKIWNIVIDGDTVITWKTSKDIEDNFDTIDFTVKSHGEYNGTKQTEVTRCNIKYK